MRQVGGVGMHACPKQAGAPNHQEWQLAFAAQSLRQGAAGLYARSGLPGWSASALPGPCSKSVATRRCPMIAFAWCSQVTATPIAARKGMAAQRVLALTALRVSKRKDMPSSRSLPHPPCPSCHSASLAPASSASNKSQSLHYRAECPGPLARVPTPSGICIHRPEK